MRIERDGGGKEGFRSGFVAIIGRPNVGKSTLLNALVGRKLAIVSDKPQTTRNRILGVLTREDCQAVFLDTPGIHKPKHRLGEYMVKVARRALKEVDLIFHLVDATAPVGPGDRHIAGYLQEITTPVLLVLNKVDLVREGEIPAILEAYRGLHRYEAGLDISALQGRNLDRLIAGTFRHLPEGPRCYPEDMITDQPEAFLVVEIIREKVLHLTREEVPHAVAVEIEEFTPRREGLLYVRAAIYVERDSQKGILIGEGGLRLKEIGRLAREELEALLGSRIYLDLWVKVSKDWRNREGALRNLGYRE